MNPGPSGEDPWVLQPCQPCSCYPSPVQVEFPVLLPLPVPWLQGVCALPPCPVPPLACDTLEQEPGFPGKCFTPWMHRDGSRNSSGNSSSTSGAALLCWWQLPAEPQLQHWSCFSIHFVAKQDGKGEGGVKSSAQLSTGTQQLQGRVWRSCCLPLPIPTPKQRGLSHQI